VVSKPVEGGAYVYQRLNFATMWEGSLMTCQGFKPYLGNPAVRHYRGAWGNVAMVELCTRLAVERARTVTLHLQRARPTSIPAESSLQGQRQPVVNRTGVILPLVKIVELG
jgi:hypothetical protein